MEQPHSSRHAKAFLDVLCEMKDPKELSEFAQELKDLSVLSHGVVGEFFSSPLFEISEKKVVLDELLEKYQLAKETRAFVHALNQLGHLQQIEEIANEFTHALLELEDVVKIQITCAHPLQDQDQKRIKDLFAKRLGKKILVESHVDKNLIGGISANIGGVVYDASIFGYLQRLEKQFQG